MFGIREIVVWVSSVLLGTRTTSSSTTRLQQRSPSIISDDVKIKRVRHIDIRSRLILETMSSWVIRTTVIRIRSCRFPPWSSMDVTPLSLNARNIPFNESPLITTRKGREILCRKTPPWTSSMVAAFPASPTKIWKSLLCASSAYEWWSLPLASLLIGSCTSLSSEIQTPVFKFLRFTPRSRELPSCVPKTAKIEGVGIVGTSPLRARVKLP